MGEAIRVDSGASGSVIPMLPHLVGRAVGSQRVSGEVLPMSDAERLAKLEGKTEAYDKMFVKMTDTLDSINQALQKLIALEQQHQALDQRHIQLREDFAASAKHQGERLGKMEDRMQSLDQKTVLNSHGRSMWERILVPIMASTASGLVVAFAVYMFLQQNVPAG